MTHVEWFRKFFDERGRGTARQICKYMDDNNVPFECSPNRRITSVSSHLNKLCKKEDGFIDRKLNEDSVYEYFLKYK